MVGNAHLAAERENERIRKIEEQQAKNRKLALKRGNIAIKNEQMNRLKATKPKHDSVKQVKLVTLSTQVDDSINTSDLSLTSSSSGSSVVSVELVNFKKQPAKISKITRDGSLNRKSGGASEIRSRSISPQKSSNFARSPTKSPRTNRISRSATSPSKTKQYKAEDYMSSLGTSTDFSALSSTDDLVPKITKISDMVNKNQKSKENEIAYLVKPRLRTVTVTSNAFPKRPILKNHNVQHINKRPQSEQPLKRTPLKRAPFRVPLKQSSSSSVTPTKKKQYVPLFKDYSGKRTISQTNENEPLIPMQQRVQFYDHANRFSKDYDASLIIEDDTPRTGMIKTTAMEEAKKERELDEIRLMKLAEAR